VAEGGRPRRILVKAPNARSAALEGISPRKKSEANPGKSEAKITPTATARTSPDLWPLAC